jgi:hypothetical protein
MTSISPFLLSKRSPEIHERFSYSGASFGSTANANVLDFQVCQEVSRGEEVIELDGAFLVLANDASSA